MPFAQDPECGHENAMFSGRVVYILGSLQLQLGVTGIVPVYAIPLQNKTGSYPVLVRSGLLPSRVYIHGGLFRRIGS